jgi:hypothetical protein
MTFELNFYVLPTEVAISIFFIFDRTVFFAAAIITVYKHRV